jgi:O-antigen ligase
LPAIAPRLLPFLHAAVGIAVAAAGMHVLLVPPALGLVLAVIVVNEVLTGRIDIPTGITSRPVLACAGFFGWAVIVSAWALLPEASLSHAVLGAIIFAAAVVCISWFGRLPQEQRMTFLGPVVIGWSLALAFVVEEQITAGWISRSVASGLFQLTGDPTLIRPAYLYLVKSGIFFNRSVAALVMLLPAALLSYSVIVRGRWGYSWLVLVVLGGAMLAWTESATAVLAFVGAVGAYLLASRWPARTALGLRLGFAALLLLALPLARTPYALGLNQWQAVPGSFRERMLIWEWTAARTLERPLLGIGMFGTQSLHSEWLKAQPPGQSRAQITVPLAARHAHNGYLEIWTELGLPGVLLALVFGWESLRTIETFSRRVQPALLGFVAACLGALGTGWSLWQPWLMATFALSVAMTAWAAMAADGSVQAEPEAELRGPTGDGRLVKSHAE